MIKEAKHLGMALGIPCLDGYYISLLQKQWNFKYHMLTSACLVQNCPVTFLTLLFLNRVEEAEAQCALLNFASLCVSTILSHDPNKTKIICGFLMYGLCCFRMAVLHQIQIHSFSVQGQFIEMFS